MNLLYKNNQGTIYFENLETDDIFWELNELGVEIIDLNLHIN